MVQKGIQGVVHLAYREVDPKAYRVALEVDRMALDVLPSLVVLPFLAALRDRSPFQLEVLVLVQVVALLLCLLPSSLLAVGLPQ